jgi:hypothetical protein
MRNDGHQRECICAAHANSRSSMRNSGKCSLHLAGLLVRVQPGELLPAETGLINDLERDQVPGKSGFIRSRMWVSTPGRQRVCQSAAS